VRGSVYRTCFCRNPETGNRYTKKSPCPKLKSPKHGKWYARYDSATEARRQPVIGPFDKKADAEEELAAAIAREGGGGAARDRQLRVAAYLDAYLAGKRKLKPRSRASDAEAYALYWKPALGAMRLVDLRDAHVSAVITAMEQVNRALPKGEEPSEMLRRMLAARADDDRRELPEGEARRKKSTRPLSPGRIERMYAPFRAAMNAAVKTKKLDFSPCTGVELPGSGHEKPLAWTPAREERFRRELARRERAAAGEGTLPAAKRQTLWSARDLRPVPAMVWTPDHTGAFIDYLEAEGERLTPLFAVAAFGGMRQDEILGLKWAETELAAGVVQVRETGSGDGPKSESGVRSVPVVADALTLLRAWRKAQAAERLAWGKDWPDTDLVFTHADGRPLTAQLVRVRFMTAAFRAGLPPVRFHDLRHGTASLLKRAGVESRVIAEILGHKRADFTERVYVTIFDEAKQEASERAAAIVPRRRPGLPRAVPE
jgi:integrase